MPTGEALSDLENLWSWRASSPYRVDKVIVEFEQGHVEVGNKQVGVVALIANHRDTLMIARQVVQLAAIIWGNQQLVAIGGVVQIWLAERPVAIDAFQIQARAPKISQMIDWLGLLKRRPIVGHIVGQDLAVERPARRNTWIIERRLIA